MEDYPRTLSDVERWFSTEAACRAYLASIRWPNGFSCPRCKGHDAWHTQRGLWVCRSCQRHVSVTAGTIFQGSRLGLVTWFRASWYVCSQKTGVSALALQRLLGLGSYQTAWTCLHKLRRAMVRPDRDRLDGRVEVDEAYWGPRRPGKRGRGAGGKTIIAVAAQEDGRKVGRIRLARVPNVTARSLGGFVQQVIKPGSIVLTDHWDAYNCLPELGYRRKIMRSKGRGGREDSLLPRAHLVVSLLKRWLMGTHHGAVRPHQLDSYLDEFTFRFNRRTSRSRGKLFYRLIQNALEVDPAPYAQLVHPEKPPPPYVGVT